MCPQVLLVLPGRSDPYALQSLDLLIDHLFLAADMVILLLTDQADPVPVFPKAQVRVVLAKEKPVLRAGRHHAVRLPVVLRDKVIDQDADIGFGPLEDKRLSSQYLHRGVDPCHQSLCRCLFISAAPVELAGAEKPVHVPGLQSQFEEVRVDAVIFDRVGVLYDHAVLESRDSSVHSLLDVVRHGRRHSVHVDLVGPSSFGLNEDLVPRLF